MIKTIFEEREKIGVAKGKAEAGRNMVLTFVRAKFGKVPKRIEDAIRRMNDPIALESLAAQAGRSKTLDEFAEML